MSEPSERRSPHGDGPGVDPRVGRALRELPAAASSPAFTEGVLVRVSAPRARRLLRPALVGAAALALVAVFVLGQRRERPSPDTGPATEPTAAFAGRGDIAAELARLRREQRELAKEIESRRALEEEPSGTVIYVGQRAGVDLVLDLARFEMAEQPPKGGRP